MHYMIMDEAMNAVDSFEDRAAAVDALETVVSGEPEAADSLLLLAYDDEGNPVGEAITAGVLAPASSALPGSRLIMLASQEIVTRVITATSGIVEGAAERLRPAYPQSWPDRYREESRSGSPALRSGNSPLCSGSPALRVSP